MRSQAVHPPYWNCDVRGWESAPVRLTEVGEDPLAAARGLLTGLLLSALVLWPVIIGIIYLSTGGR
jgi:hypothetical protein